MATNFDRMKETLKEIKVPHTVSDDRRDEPKVITIANTNQGTRCHLGFDKNGRFLGVAFE